MQKKIDKKGIMWLKMYSALQLHADLSVYPKFWGY